MVKFPTFECSWPWPWPWIGPYCIPSCISRRPLPTYQISLKSKKVFVDGRTDGRMDGHLRPALLGRLGRLWPKNWLFDQLRTSNLDTLRFLAYSGAEAELNMPHVQCNCCSSMQLSNMTHCLETTTSNLLKRTVQLRRCTTTYQDTVTRLWTSWTALQLDNSWKKQQAETCREDWCVSIMKHRYIVLISNLICTDTMTQDVTFQEFQFQDCSVPEGSQVEDVSWSNLLIETCSSGPSSNLSCFHSMMSEKQ